MTMADPVTLAVHRCRFVEFTPAAITALAFPPLNLPAVRPADKGKSKQTPAYSTAKFGTLAVGRANGNIEICEWSGAQGETQAPQAWVVRKTLSGLQPSKVDSMAFSIRFPNTAHAGTIPPLSDLRLFSSGGGSELLEWDITRSCVRRSINSQGGAIWSFAVNPASTLLALGCEDGTVRLLSLEYDTLSHLRRFDRAKCRLLSIAWGPPVLPASKPRLETATSDDDSDDDDLEWTDEWLVTGGSDSALRKWDVKTGRVTDRMTTDRARGERTLVWTVGTLGDGTIVSGDSMGHVKFWDSRTATQLQTFKGHAADVLCMTIGPDGTSVYTSGVDQKVTQFALVKPSSSEKPSLLKSGSHWIQASSKRLHSHDVRSVAIWPPYTPLPATQVANSNMYRFPADVAPILASGGLDMSVTLTPAALPKATGHRLTNPLSTSVSSTFEDSYHRRLAYPTGAAGTSALSLARSARMLACAAEAGISVWRLLPRAQHVSPLDDPDANDGGWEKILDMDLASQTNIISSSISDDGHWLVASDLAEAKLFSLKQTASGDIKPKRLRSFPALLQSALPLQPSTSSSDPSSGCSACIFTPDSSKLAVATSTTSYIILFDVSDADNADSRVLRRFDQHRRSGLGRAIRGRTVSVDADGDAPVGVAPADDDDEDDDSDEATSVGIISRMAISADGQWLASTDDLCRTHVFNLDSMQHHCVLPSLPQPAQTLAFDPSSPHLLIIGMANNTLQVYDVEARTQPDWARSLSANLPKRFTHMHDTMLGVCFDPGATPTSAAMDAPAMRPRHALFWGSTWLCKVQLDAPVGWGGFSKKRRRNGPKASSTPDPMSTEGNFKVVTHYRPILFADFIGPGELVIVERPPIDVLAGLPPAFWKPKYGAS